MITLENIEMKLKKAYDSNENSNSTSATKVFHNALAELTELNQNLTAYSSSIIKNEKKRSYSKEFLVDFCISREQYISNEVDQKDNIIIPYWTGLHLICESEWHANFNEVVYDFQKLAIIKAEFKIIIFYIFSNKQNGQSDFEEKVEILKSSISPELLNDGSNYVFCGNGEDFYFSKYKK